MKKQTKKKIRTIIVNAILIAVFIAMVVTIFKIFNARTKNKVYFVFNKYSLMWVLTNSMEDLIPAQSYILVENAEGKTISRGMIISFYSEDPAIYGKLNTHVVLGITHDEDGNTEYITRPYRSEQPDAYTVPAENVVAVYVCNVPFLTGLGKFIQGTGGKILIGTLVLGFTALWFIRSYLSKLIAARDRANNQRLHDELERRIMAEELERIRVRGTFYEDNNLEVPIVTTPPINTEDKGE